MQANKTRNGSHRKYFQGTTENGTNSDRIMHQTSGVKVTNTKNTLFIVRKLTLLLIVLSYDYIEVLNCMAYKWLTLWCTMWNIYPSSIWLGEALPLVLGSWLPSDTHWQANPAWDLVAMDVMSHLGYLMMSPWEQWPWQWDMDRHHFQVTWWHHRSRSHIQVTNWYHHDNSNLGSRIKTYGAGSIAKHCWPDCTSQVHTGHIEESNLSPSNWHFPWTS